MDIGDKASDSLSLSVLKKGRKRLEARAQEE